MAFIQSDWKKHVRPGWYPVRSDQPLIYSEMTLKDPRLQWCREQFGHGNTTNLYQGQGWRLLGTWGGGAMFEFEQEQHAMWFALRWT